MAEFVIGLPLFYSERGSSKAVNDLADQFPTNPGSGAIGAQTTLLASFGVIGANVGFEFFVALQLEFAHHLIERRTGGPQRKV